MFRSKRRTWLKRSRDHPIRLRLRLSFNEVTLNARFSQRMRTAYRVFKSKTHSTTMSALRLLQEYRILACLLRNLTRLSLQYLPSSPRTYRQKPPPTITSLASDISNEMSIDSQVPLTRAQTSRYRPCIEYRHPVAS